jgi:photosystem II stability/assembly factor-like uncharacterized protein
LQERFALDRGAGDARGYARARPQRLAPACVLSAKARLSKTREPIISERQADARPPRRRAWIAKHRGRRAPLAWGVALAIASALIAGLAAPSALAGQPLSWSAQAIPGAGALSAISCPTESLCVAVDASGRALRTLDPTAAVPSWGAVAVTGTPLSAVSCASATLCVAVGGHGAFTSGDGGASWSPPASIDPEGTLTSVVCPAASLCVAVDQAGRAFATNGPGSASWPSFEIDPANHLQAVSCSSASSCVTVDTAGRAFGTQSPTSGVWPGRPIDAFALNAVSCSPSGPCVAVDAKGNALVSADAGSAASTWSSTPIDAGRSLGAISCASSGLCVALDEHQAFASDNALAAIPSWTASNADAAALTGISCLPAGLCVAVDAAGRAISGRVPPPLVSTSPPAEAGANEATLAGVIDPHDGALTSCTFEYGSSAAYGQSVPCAALPAAAGGAQIVTATIAGLAPNTTYHYRLLAANLGGAATGSDQTLTTAVSSAVARVTPHPSIHGTPAVASHLSCQSGVPSGSARLSYAWLRDLIPIPRATGSSYTVTGADSGHHLQCEVTASNAGGTVTARSAFVTIPVQGVVAAAGETVVGRARYVKGAVRVPIRCSVQASSGCRISIRVIGVGRTAVLLGGTRVRLTRGQHRTVLAPLNANGRRLAAHGHNPTVRLTVTGTVIGVIEASLSRQRVRL